MRIFIYVKINYKITSCEKLQSLITHRTVNLAENNNYINFAVVQSKGILCMLRSSKNKTTKTMP